MRTDRSLAWKSLQGISRALATVLLDLKVHGRDNVPARGGVLIVSNHQSNLDPILLAVRLDRPLNYIAKAELFENPFSSWFLRSLVNAFPVRHGANDVGAVKETIRRLRAGHLLNIYPEGARTLDGEIGLMQRGVGLIVHRARVPVVPVVIAGAFEAWSIHQAWLRPAPVRVRYGSPMDLAGLTPDEIVERIDQTLREMFVELRGRNGANGHAHPLNANTAAGVRRRSSARSGDP